MFKRKQSKNDASKGGGQGSLPFVQEIIPFKQILQKYGHSPWTKQVLADVHAISDLEDKFAKYMLVYKPSNLAKRDSAAIRLLWEACNESYLCLAACREENVSMHKKLSQAEKEIEKWKVLGTGIQSQLDSLRDAFREEKQKERELVEQVGEKDKIEKIKCYKGWLRN